MKKQTDEQLVEENWACYEYGKTRGHRKWALQAQHCENMYLGAGRQWEDSVRQAMTDSNRLTIEDNRIMESVHTVIGYQISNRLDIALKPRGRGADDETAKVMSKVMMQVCDNVKLKFMETQVWKSALIKHRGYYDLSLDFSQNIHGEISLTAPDPFDVIPDPDAKDYDPDKWGWVIKTRWLTEDEIAGDYGEQAAKKVKEGRNDNDGGEEDFGSHTDANEVERNHFGNDDFGSYSADGSIYSEGTRRYRIIDRQKWVTNTAKVYVTVEGDVRSEDSLTKEQAAELVAAGAIMLPKRVRSVQWIVSTQKTMIMNTKSPFEHFTIIPMFAIFAGGQTLGMVDNAIDGQIMLNKSLSTWVDGTNKTANSGWLIEENSLSNIDTDDLETVGASSGLVLEYRKGTTKPEKITGTPPPQSLVMLVEHARASIKSTTAVNERATGGDKLNESGVAIQAKQWFDQLSIAPMLDNLAYTRNLLAHRILKLIQRFMTEPQIIRIAEIDNFGQKVTKELPLNQPQGDGSVLNNVTAGEYDIVVTEQPTQVTFENGQFQQAFELYKAGVIPPDMRHIVIRSSTLSDKTEILEQIQASAGQANPLDEAKAMLVKAQTALAEANTISARVETLYSAINAAQLAATIPQAAGLADAIAQSAGFVDSNAAPIFPAVDPGMQVPPPIQSTNPGTPPNPDVGMKTGIESPTV